MDGMMNSPDEDQELFEQNADLNPETVAKKKLDSVGFLMIDNNQHYYYILLYTDI